MSREAWEEKEKKGGATSATLSVRELRRILGAPLAVPILGF